MEFLTKTQERCAPGRSIGTTNNLVVPPASLPARRNQNEHIELRKVLASVPLCSSKFGTTRDRDYSTKEDEELHS